VLYRAESVPFTPDDRRRLLDGSTRFVYIRIADQAKFRQQTEASITDVVSSPSRAVSEKSAIVYETGIELINELLAEPDLVAHSARLENMSRAITTLVLNDTDAFSHLFAASHHDFYTATHMVNVATWMVPLSYRLGYREPEELARICQAGLLHDIGKIFIPEQVLNKPVTLTDEDLALIRRHPTLGWEHLGSFANVPRVVRLVTRQHHERLDGTGYPDGLVGDQIHRVSRICAVVDSFDAMTALRPFRKRTVTVSDAILILKSETPRRFDPQVVEVWLQLLRAVDDRDLATPAALLEPAAQADAPVERRRNKRFNCQRAARMHILTPAPDGGWEESSGLQVTMHNVSRFGLGVLSPTEVKTGERVRVYFMDRGWSGKFVQGETVRCRVYQDGWYEIGVELSAAENELPGT
jgi:HD-GYP domain-containing protein (c-di-GMP phosphodiesterase class II)